MPPPNRTLRVLALLVLLGLLSSCSSSLTRRLNGPENAFLYVNGSDLGSFPRYVSVDFSHVPRILVQVRKIDHEPLEVWYSEAEFRAIPPEGVTLELRSYGR
ncbi:MAG: hypothetical protein ACYTG5_13850 [Planctomycetota bacterium]|jgi:hypothetical protein